MSANRVICVARPGVVDPVYPHLLSLGWEVHRATDLRSAKRLLTDKHFTVGVVAHTGMTDPDTLWYHVPYAARWVQEGSLTALHFTSYEPLTTFYPSTPSLLHAIPMLTFGTELLSPYLNLGWLALALTAGE